MPHPGARRAVGAALWRGEFVIHGGFGLDGRVDPGAVAGDLWAWRDRWIRLAADGPPPARYPSLCPADDGLHRFGGCTVEAGVAAFTDALWRWDERWTELRPDGPRPAPRYTSALAIRDGGLVMFGGHSQDGAGGKTFHGDLWRFGGGRWSRVHGAETGPGPRYGFGWAQDGAALYLFGGYDGARDCADFWRLDLDALAWERLADGPPARYCPALGPVDGALVLFGGRSKTDPRCNFDDCWIYRDGAWHRHRDPGPGYHAKPGYASDGTAMWLYAGEGPRGHLSDLWRFDRRGWTCLDPGSGDDPVLW